jgi:HAE1 family hydrophobic/amphiphilic exporter-1
MTLPELSVKRHVLAWMLNAVLVLFGVISFSRIGMDRLPYIEFPVVSVTTALKGANPDIVDASVTNLIEGSVNSVPGIEHIQSTSSPGVSVINITFGLEKNVDIAFNEVQSKVNQVLRRLPKDVDPPIVAKVETNAAPMFWMALQGDRTQQQLNQYALNVVKKKLETIDGVGEVRLGGRRDRTIRVNLLPERMTALAISAQDIANAFATEHVQLAGGFVVGQATEHLVKLDLEFHTLDALGGLVLAQRNGVAVRLGDVAELDDGLTDNRQLARFNGEMTVGLGVVKVANANTVAIAERIKQKLANEIEPQLPPGMKISIVSNDAVFILEIVNSLKEHLIEGTLLAALVVWFFLRSLRSTLIIALAIPVSLMGAIAVIYFFGYTLNSLTMLALLLLIGVVVDDAIVVLENIFRHREEIDPEPVSAAINGSREVVFAVIAATLSLVSIFAPVIFLQGVLGQFFRSFAVVVTFGVLVSLFVSLTLTPMLCSRYLRVEKQHGRIYHLLDGILGGLDRLYVRLLDAALTPPLVGGGADRADRRRQQLLLHQHRQDLHPRRGRRPLPRLAAHAAGLQHRLHRRQAARGRGGAQQLPRGAHRVRADRPRQRRPGEPGHGGGAHGAARGTQAQPAAGDRRCAPRPRRHPRRARLRGALLHRRRRPARRTAAVRPCRREHRRSRPPDARTAAEARHLPGIGRVDTDLQLDLPQLVFRPDRLRIANANLSTADVALAVNMLTGGIDIAKFNDEPGDGQRYDIRVKAKEGAFTQPADLSKIFLRNRDGKLVRLDSVARFEEKLGPAVIGRFDLQYAATFYATPTIPLGEAVVQVRAAAAEILPAGYQVKLIGQAEEFGKTQKYMSFAFGLALVLLYMVLASQFNSFLQPAIVMLAQPLAVVGGIAALWLFGHTLNIYSMIGLTLLIGLVAKNSILLVDLTNQRREQGMAVDAACAMPARSACARC